MAFPSSKLLLTLTLLSIAASGNILPCARAQTVGSNTTVVAGQVLCPMPTSILAGTLVAQLIKPIANTKADLVCGVGTAAVTLGSTVTNSFGGVGIVLVMDNNLLNLMGKNCKLRMSVAEGVCTNPVANGEFYVDLYMTVMDAFMNLFTPVSVVTTF